MGPKNRHASSTSMRRERAWAARSMAGSFDMVRLTQFLGFKAVQPHNNTSVMASAHHWMA